METELTPLLRGVFHLWALWAALAAGIVLVVLADGALETVSSWVYAAASPGGAPPAASGRGGSTTR